MHASKYVQKKKKIQKKSRAPFYLISASTCQYLPFPCLHYSVPSLCLNRALLQVQYLINIPRTWRYRKLWCSYSVVQLFQTTTIQIEWSLGWHSRLVSQLVLSHVLLFCYAFMVSEYHVIFIKTAIGLSHVIAVYLYLLAF